MPKPVQPVLILALSPQEAAAALGIHVDHVYRALRERRLLARMYGNKRRISVKQIFEWFETWSEAPLPKIKQEKTQ